MKSFRIITTSWALSILSSFLMILSGLFLSSQLFYDNKTPYWISCLLVVTLAFFLQRFISKGEVLLTLENDMVTVKWKRQYIFHKRPDRQIPLATIKSYKYQPDRNFDLFRITLEDGTELNLWHFTLTRDDFELLVYAFPSFVEDQNKKPVAKNEKLRIEKPHKIEREKTIFQGAASHYLAILAVLTIIAVPAILISGNNKDSSNYTGIAAFSGAVFFLSQYLKHRKKSTGKKGKK